MCEQFYERLGERIVTMTGNELMEVRSVKDKDKLAWVLLNFPSDANREKHVENMKTISETRKFNLLIISANYLFDERNSKIIQ